MVNDFCVPKMSFIYFKLGKYYMKTNRIHNTGMRCTISSKKWLYHKTGLLFAATCSPIEPISDTASAHKAGRPIPQGCLSLLLNKMDCDVHFLLNSVLSMYVSFAQSMPSQWVPWGNVAVTMPKPWTSNNPMKKTVASIFWVVGFLLMQSFDT